MPTRKSQTWGTAAGVDEHTRAVEFRIDKHKGLGMPHLATRNGSSFQVWRKSHPNGCPAATRRTRPVVALAPLPRCTREAVLGAATSRWDSEKSDGRTHSSGGAPWLHHTRSYSGARPS